MKKKSLSLLLAILGCFALVLGLTACDIRKKEQGLNGLEYVLLGDEYAVAGIGTFAGTDLEIPSTYNGKPVTSITYMAFTGCSGLTSVTIPNSVTSIGNSAFSACSGLTTVTIPDSVTNIGNQAFYNCTNLTNVTIGNSVTSIGEFAFSYCSGLTSITISDSVTNIYNQAFFNTGYYNDENNWQDGVLYIGNHLIEAKEDISGSYTVKDGTKTIADSAFNNRSTLTSISIPDSVSNIGQQAFYGTGYYNDENNWQDGVLYIGNHLIRALSSYLSGSYTVNAGTKVIADGAFGYCEGLSDITIPNSVTNIGKDAFHGCSGLSDITIENNAVYHSAGSCLIETSTKTLIAGCKNSVIPTDGSVTSIGGGAFSGRSGLANIAIPNSVTSIGGSAFYGCEGLTNITIPNSIKKIGDYAFSYCSKLTSITIPNSVTIIGAEAFCGCGELVNVAIPNSVTSIERALFSRCSKLTSITIPNSVTSIGNSAFAGCIGLTGIVIPNSVISIGDHVFYECSGLTSVTIPDSVTSIGGGVFSGTGYLEDESNWKDGALYIGNHLISADTGTSESFTIKDGTKTIAGMAFWGSYKLSSITIPNSVITIGDSAFAQCSELKSVTIPNSVTSIGIYAFRACSKLESITIDSSLTKIGSGAFYGCGELKDITFNGTKTGWNKINKSSYWDRETGSYTIHCSDGDIEKE